MKKHKLKQMWLLFFIIFMLTTCVIIGIIVRHSFHNDVSPRMYIDNPRYKVRISSSAPNNCYILPEAVEDLNDLESPSEVIVKIKVNSNNERYMHSMQTVTEANVMEIYKGDIEDEKIYILEPVCYFKEGDFVISTDGYYWLREDEEYIMFLKKYEDIHIGKAKYIYIPVCAAYGQFCLSKEFNDEISELDIETQERIDKVRHELWQDVIEKY